MSFHFHEEEVKKEDGYEGGRMEKQDRERREERECE